MLAFAPGARQRRRASSSASIPALQASKAQLTSALRDQSGQTTASRSTGAFRKGLVILQTAISLLLLISAGLFGKTLLNLTKVDLGIRVDHLLTFGLTPKLSGYSRRADGAALSAICASGWRRCPA